MVYDISAPQLHKTQFELSKTKAERSCNIIRRSRGSRAQLATVVSTCIMKRAEYTGKFSALTDSQTQELDKLFTHAFKDLTLNLNSFPDALIYLDRNLGGLGFPKLSDCVGEAKYSMQQRHLHAQGMVANTMDTLLYNGVVQSSQTPYAATGVIVAAPQELSPNFWATVSSNSQTRAVSHYVVKDHFLDDPPPPLLLRELDLPLNSLFGDMWIQGIFQS
jgi:hypothetical protein